MDRIAQELGRQSRLAGDIPHIRTGNITGVNTDGSLQVTIGKTVIACAADRRMPSPSNGPVIMLYCAGQYTVLACPGKHI